jgi:hypothetical protein
VGVVLSVWGASAWVCGVRLHELHVRFVIHSPQYVQEVHLCLRTSPARYTLWSSLCGTKQKKLFFLYSASSDMTLIIGHDWPDLGPRSRRGPSPLMSSLSRFRGRIYFNWVYLV